MTKASTFLTMKVVQATQTSKHKVEKILTTINNLSFGCGDPLASLKL